MNRIKQLFSFFFVLCAIYLTLFFVQWILLQNQSFTSATENNDDDISFVSTPEPEKKVSSHVSYDLTGPNLIYCASHCLSSPLSIIYPIPLLFECETNASPRSPPLAS